MLSAKKLKKLLIRDQYRTGLNLYDYAKAKPLSFVDEMGLISGAPVTYGYQIDLYESDWGPDDHIAHFELQIKVKCQKIGNVGRRCCWKPVLAGPPVHSATKPQSMGWPFGFLDDATSNVPVFHSWNDNFGWVMGVYWSGQASEGGLKIMPVIGSAAGSVIGGALGGLAGSFVFPALGTGFCAKSGMVVGTAIGFIVTAKSGDDFGGSFGIGSVIRCSCSGKPLRSIGRYKTKTYGDDEIYWKY